MRKELIDGVNIPIPESYKDCVLLALSDYYRYCGKKATLCKMLIYSLKNECFAFSLWLRLSAFRLNIPILGGVIYCVPKLFKTIIGRRRGIMISEKMPIGYGLYLSHGFGIIVNPKAIIGSNCMISQFTTIGAIEGKAAVVGDNVYIGPNVCLVENVHVGSNSIIGAGSVVVRDVPHDSIVAGTPAKVISDKNTKNYICNPWIIKWFI